MRTALCLLLCTAGAIADIQLSYAGFDHLILFDTSKMSATAYDYRRDVSNRRSACDTIPQPPLVNDAVLMDWISESTRKSETKITPAFTYLGYELFMISVSCRSAPNFRLHV